MNPILHIVDACGFLRVLVFVFGESSQKSQPWTETNGQTRGRSTLRAQEINPKMEGCSPWNSLAYPLGFWFATRVTTRYDRYIRSYMVDLPTWTAGGSPCMGWILKVIFGLQTLLAFDFKGWHTQWGWNAIKGSLSFFGWNMWYCNLFQQIWHAEGTPSSHLRITLMSPRRESNLMQCSLKKSFCSRQSFSQMSISIGCQHSSLPSRFSFSLIIPCLWC